MPGIIEVDRNSPPHGSCGHVQSQGKEAAECPPFVHTALHSQGQVLMETKSRRPKEVFRVHLTVLSATVFVALLLQATLPATLPLTRLFQWPLLVTVYFSMIRQNQTFGIALGTVIGLLQDALSHAYLGQMGMAKALVGYLAAMAGLKFEFDNLLVRGLLLASMVFIHNGFNYLLVREVLGLPPPFKPLYLTSTVLVNVALGLILFPVFDRMRQSA